MYKVMKISVKKWYLGAYPEDMAGGSVIDPEATFSGLFNCLDDYGDIYIYLGDGVDSCVRERVFERLALLMGVEYGYIYDQWLKCYTDSPIFDKSGKFTGYFREGRTGHRVSLEVIEKRYNSYNL